MSSPFRILFVAETAAALQALASVRQGGPVQAQLAPSAQALSRSLADPADAAVWDAVVFVPGGAVEEVEVAVYVPDGLALFVLADEVPLLLTETAAVAIAASDLPTLIARLASAASEPTPAPEPARLGEPVGTLGPDFPTSDPLDEDGPARTAAAPPTDATPSDENIPTTSPLPRGHGEGWMVFEAGEEAHDSIEAPSPPPLSPPVQEGDFVGEFVLVSSAEGEVVHDAPEAGEEAPSEPEPALAVGQCVTDDPSAAVMPAHLASLADQLAVGLYRSTPEGEILYANPALAELLGADSVDALHALHVRGDLGYPRDAFAEEIARTGVVRNLVVTWTRMDGARVHTRENARSILDDDGCLVAYEGTMEDVTAEVDGQIEEKALARQHRAMAAFAGSAGLAEDPISIQCAAVGALLDATGAEWVALLTAEDARVAATAGGAPSALATVADHLPSLTTAPTVVPSTERGTSDLARALHEMGVRAYAAVPVRRGADALGVLLWGFGEPCDITATDIRGADALAWHLGSHLDRAQALQALRDAQASLETVTQHTPHVLYRLRYAPDGPIYEYLSPAIETLTGLPRAEVDARGGPGSLVETRHILEGEGLATGPVEGAEAYHAVYRMATVFGSRWVENSARLWRDPAGQPIGLIGVLQDITDRKEREDELADAAQNALIRQRALVDLAHLDGADAFGGPAAAVVAATLGASDVSFWLGAPGEACRPLYAPARVDPSVALSGGFASVLAHVRQHRALAVADAAADPHVAELGLDGFVRAFGLRAVLIAPIRREGRVSGFVAIHQTAHAHDWDPAETEFAAAVADAVALALEREDRERLVAELVEAREAAEAGRDAAEQINRLKNAFLANMSHEVRTPLTGILGFAEVLKHEAPADLQDVVEKINRNGHRLLDTLTAVLDLSRLEAGEYDADRRPATLAPLVAAAAAPFEEAAADKGLRFDLDLAPDVAASVDADALGQILSHVIGNAVKFTDLGGVLVTLEATPEAAVLRVADTGRGISQAFLPEVLDAFRQEDTGHARSHEGSGLGLTIARRLVHLHEGEIWIESEQPGGTVVTISLPRLVGFVPPQASPRARVTGDGLPDQDLHVSLPDAADPGNLLGDPFDFTFLTSAAPTVVASAPLESPPPPPTDMFDFRFGRSSAPDPAPKPVPPPAAPPPTPPSRAATPPMAPSRPAAPAPAPPVPASAPPPPPEPVMIIRAQPSPGPTIPEVAPPEDAEVVAEPDGDGRPTILVVEDNDDTRMLLERILRSAYNVTAVSDARSALLAMNQQRFGCLVLDINLGGKETGADVLRIARSLPDYDGVFAIALTAYALPGDRERLLESGFSAYISKPFTRQSLMETLAQAVGA